MLNLLQPHEACPAEVQEVREIQTALDLVAAEAGLCVILLSVRQMRSHVHYRLPDAEGAISPLILSHRIGRNGLMGACNQNRTSRQREPGLPWSRCRDRQLAAHWPIAPAVD